MLLLAKIIFTNIFFLISGKIFYEYLFRKKVECHQSEIAIFGTIIISFFALLINFFFPLSKILNTLILIIPIFFFLNIN